MTLMQLFMVSSYYGTLDCFVCFYRYPFMEDGMFQHVLIVKFMAKIN